MKARIIRVCLAVIFSCGFLSLALAQDAAMGLPRRGGDPNNALIEGKILMPSGQSANFNIKIILSDLKSQLTSFYTNKFAEFRFPNLSEGEYFVEARADEKLYEPVRQRILLGRSQIYQLTLTLRRKEEVVSRRSGSQTVTSLELDQSIPPAARKEYERSVKSVGRGDVYRAIEHLQRAIAIYPDYVDAHNDLGAQCLKLKRFGEAAEHFRTALEKNPKYFNARFNLGLVSIEQKDYPTAIAQLNEAVNIDSARPDAHLWLGVAMLQTGNLPQAERELSKALVMGGEDFAVAHYYLAQLYLRRKDEAEASRALKAYLEALPKGEYGLEAKQLLDKLNQTQKDKDRRNRQD